LKFILAGEPRQDFIAWLLSPFYGKFQPHRQTLLHWDLAWRQAGAAYGLEALEKARSSNEMSEPEDPVWSLIRQALALLSAGEAPAAMWQKRLLQLWELTGFPAVLESKETDQWQALLNLLEELARAGGKLLWTAATLVEWLTWEAGRLEQPGEGSSEAGIQIQGLLELRGLDFEVVFCLGLNLGVFPPPPRNLPLLTGREKALVLGGDYQSQQEFAQTSYKYLLAAAPALVLTRPLVDQEEDQLASPIIPPIWGKDPVRFAALSQAHPAWRRSPAVAAVFDTPQTGPSLDAGALIPMKLPDPLSISALETALACPCRFYLNVLLGLEELPDLKPGLPPLERGSLIHKVLQTFTERFQSRLRVAGVWDDAAAWQQLLEAVAEHQPQGHHDPHWEAETARWLAEPGGVLREWLRGEKLRYQNGWLWLAMETSFTGLRLPGWPTAVKGRLDRIDTHQDEGLMLWDYKTGDVPGSKEITEARHQFQLAGYLLAVQQGLITTPAPQARAGIIGLKSSRAKHLKFEDYQLTAKDWQEVLQDKLTAVATVGERVGEGDFRPDPSQPLPGPTNSCPYCPYALLCGYRPVGAEAEPE
jgi:RecB family exonuclease